MTAPTQTFAQNQKVAVYVQAFASDGVTEDTTTTLQLSSSSPPVCQASIDPTNNRKVWLQNGSVTGTCNVNVNVPGSPQPPLVIPVVVTAPINLARVDFISADPPVPR